MTFFDKLFNIRNRSNKPQCGIAKTSESFCFSSSNLDISKEQIRVVLFRECDRRGRKLLFDSNSVEKLPLTQTSGFSCKQTSNQACTWKMLDLVEVTSTHGYRYKKPCHDVSLLGEMIFGSVAMMYKGGNTCKIHSIPSPNKCVMFTTVIYVPNKCHNQAFSEKSSNGYCTGSSLGSLDDTSNQNETSSSDSRLYKPPETVNTGVSSYPSIKNGSNHCRFSNFYRNGSQESVWKRSFLRKSRKTDCLEKMCSDNSGNEMCDDNINQVEKRTDELNNHDKFYSENIELDLSVPKSDVDCRFSDRQGSCGSSSMLFQGVSDSKNGSNSQISSLSGSLGSLRRRWMQSFSASVDASFDEAGHPLYKPRTKLGMGLVIDLSDTLPDEIEKFLFNHTILIDSIMNKLQSSVEMAYSRKENFVDLLYSAFLDCQQSVFELITTSNFDKTLWLALSEETSEEAFETPVINSQYQENIKSCRKQTKSEVCTQKFVNEFCDVLAKFDTKDTNFFISTLLTAVLTNHLSWVTGIAFSQHPAIENLQPYNPLWAQLNDLCGILGAPLKSAKTVVTGSNSNRAHMTTIIQMLTYFIRCYNVMENVYDVNIDEIINIEGSDLTREKKFVDDFENFDSGIDRSYDATNENPKKNGVNNNTSKDKEVNLKKQKNAINEEKMTDVGVSGKYVKIWASAGNVEDSRRITENNLQRSCVDGLRRTKSSLSCLKDLKIQEDVQREKLYPNIKDLAEIENVSLAELSECTKDRTFAESQTTEKTRKLIRVPSSAVEYHVQQNLSPDEGYDTVDSSEAFPEKVENEFSMGISPPKKTEDVMFVLGENDLLGKKVVMTKSATVIMEKEDSELVLCERKLSLTRSKSMNIPHYNRDKMSDKRCRTLGNPFCVRECDVRTLWQDSENEDCQQHFENGGVRKVDPTPWIQCELPMPRSKRSTCSRRKLNVSAVLGSVTDHYNSEKIIQGVVQQKKEWKRSLINDLMLSAHYPVLDRELSEALCIVADMETWEVLLCSSHTSAVDRSRCSGVRVGMSQLVGDMLESFLHLHRIKLPPDYCLQHLERKLHEIYEKSKTVAELLDTTECCSMDYLTTRLDVTVNDVPLLFSIATTHSPHITSKYGLSFT